MEPLRFPMRGPVVRDGHGRVLLCQLTYKRDWDLPGGVVEVGESPRLAVGREIEEELALAIDAGGLLLTDWLPPWGGWDDAVCLVFDGGVHDPAILNGSRRRRIAAGAGTDLTEVNRLIKQHAELTKLMKQLSGGGGRRAAMSGLMGRR